MNAIAARGRKGERGVSILEALIVTVIAGLLLVILLPLIPQSMRRDSDGAYAAIAMEAAVRGERVYRGALRSFVQQPAGAMGAVAVVSGNAVQVTGLAIAEQDLGCMAEGQQGAMQLRVERRGRGGALVCDGPAGVVDALRWSEGAAQFVYSEDGVRWSGAWPAYVSATPQRDSASVVVRFELSARGRDALVWSERAGWTEAADIAAAAGATP